MGLISDVRTQQVQEKLKTRACALGKLLDTLTKAERAELQEWLDSDDAHTEIAAGLRTVHQKKVAAKAKNANAYAVGIDSIRRHRNKGCCGQVPS